ncbi:MAG TPA: contractile injection system protein, VgrG/Pvc8 family [Verrucomicrobiae bacterium]|jgi:phage protein D
MPAAENSPATYSATPTVRLDGEENERLASLITAMDMTEQTGGMSSLELRLTNVASLTDGGAETAFDADGDLELGSEIIIGAGDTTAPVEIFRGTITALEGEFTEDRAPALVVLAEDALQRTRLARRTKVFENSSLADIVRSVASLHGLTPQISGLDQNFGTQVQMNESDLAFLRRLLARVDADVQIVGMELHASPRAAVRRGELELELGPQLKCVRVIADLAHQVTAATVKGWDVSSGSAVDADGQDNALGPGDGQKSAEILQDKFSGRKHHSGHLASFNQSEVTAIANAIRNGRARRFVRVIATAEGNPALRVGTHVRLTGLPKWFANTFYVVKARHLFDLKEGYRVEFEGECALLGRQG